MGNNDLCIMVAFHKEYFYVESRNFFQIQVGKELSNIKLDMRGDNEGVNISSKNKNYCELTALYWAWKNVDAQYYGLMHYRRYFYIPMLHNTVLLNLKKQTKKILNSSFKTEYKQGRPVLQVKSKTEAKQEINKLDQYLTDKDYSNYDVIIPFKILVDSSIKEQFILNHIASDWSTLEEIIRTKFPFIYSDFEVTMNSNELYPYNMFIMKKEYFFQYMEFLFSVFTELEKSIDLEDRSDYQKRVFGFISERLLTVYFNYLKRSVSNLKYKEADVMFLDFPE